MIPASGSDGPAAPYPSTIDVTGFEGCTLTDLNVTLNDLSHTSPREIDTLLVRPGGQNAIIMSDTGGLDDAVNVTLTLDDEAANPIPTSLVSDTFRPTNEGGGDTFFPPAPTPSGGSALSVFDGTSPNGAYSLFVFDDGLLDVGSFAGGFSLEITAECPAAPPPPPAPQQPDQQQQQAQQQQAQQPPAGGGPITQEVGQEAESGEVDLSFDVS